MARWIHERGGVDVPEDLGPVVAVLRARVPDLSPKYGGYWRAFVLVEDLIHRLIDDDPAMRRRNELATTYLLNDHDDIRTRTQ